MLAVSPFQWSLKRMTEISCIDSPPPIYQYSAHYSALKSKRSKSVSLCLELKRNACWEYYVNSSTPNLPQRMWKHKCLSYRQR